MISTFIYQKSKPLNFWVLVPEPCKLGASEAAGRPTGVFRAGASGIQKGTSSADQKLTGVTIRLLITIPQKSKTPSRSGMSVLPSEEVVEWKKTIPHK